MAKTKEAKTIPKIINTIVDAIQDKKGENIVSLDLRKINDAVCDFFIICHGDSSLQIKAITDAIEEKTLKILNIKHWHKEGYENMEWVLLDYVDVVVHVFHKEKRYFYNIEELWSDAVVNEFRSA